MSTTPLKNCPFCGTANVRLRRDDTAYIAGLVYVVICSSCGATGANKGYGQDAVTAWNTRAESQELSQLKRERDELLKDKERLDWLIANNFQSLSSFGGVRIEYRYYNHLREAIDAAINSQQKEWK